MNYTSAVSIIPGGCPQFLDCRLDAKSLGRFWAYFREIPQTGESAIASARRQVELVPVPLDDTGQPGDYDYKIDANRALEAFTGRWVPVPFLRLSNEQWKDGAFKCEKGPSNGARLHVSREDSDGAYRLTFLFDTTIEEREQPTGQYFALCDDDVAENARFAQKPRQRVVPQYAVGRRMDRRNLRCPPDRAPQRADHMAREYAVHHGAPRHVPDAP